MTRSNDESYILDEAFENRKIIINPEKFQLSFMNESFIDNTLLHNTAICKELSGSNSQLIGDMIIETENGFVNKRGASDIEEIRTGRCSEYSFSLNNEAVSVFIENTKLSDEKNIKTKRVYVKVGNNGLFIVDFVSASVPVKVSTPFIFTDYIADLDLKIAKTDRLVARKNKAGIKLFNIYNEADAENAGYELFFKPCIFFSGTEGVNSAGGSLLPKGLICIYKSPVYARDHIKIYSIAASDCADIRSWHMYFEGNPCVHIEPSSRQGGYEMNLMGEKIKLTDKVSEKEAVFDLNKM